MPPIWLASFLTGGLLVETPPVTATHPSALVRSFAPGSSDAAVHPKPAPPAAAVELPIDQIFRRPIGPQGLEYSEQAKALIGKTVRIHGYMVRQTAPVPFSLLLAPLPMQMHEREYGLADDLPANTVHVVYPRGPMPVIPHGRGILAVEGVLELGPSEAADGRVSHVRLLSPAPWHGHRSPAGPVMTSRVKAAEAGR